MDLLNMRKDKGFTLVEMIVVIAIMGIVSAVAIPNFYSYAAGMRLRSASRDLLSNMQKARMNAIRYRNIINHDPTPLTPHQNTLWCVQFTATGYQVINCGRDGGRCAAPSATDDIVEGFTKTETVNLAHSYPGMTFKQDYSAVRLVFYPDGTIDNDDNPITPFDSVYSLKDSRGDELELRIRGAGAIKIKRPQDP
jgi:prepilin-type N-terminal cleavage/methylation domain-containing protein